MMAEFAPIVFKFITQNKYEEETDDARFSTGAYNDSDLPKNVQEVVTARIDLDKPDDLPVFIELLSKNTIFGKNKYDMIKKLMGISINAVDRRDFYNLEETKNHYYTLYDFSEDKYFASIEIMASLVRPKNELADVGLKQVSHKFKEALTQYLVNEEKSKISLAITPVLSENTVPKNKIYKV